MESHASTYIRMYKNEILCQRIIVDNRFRLQEGNRTAICSWLFCRNERRSGFRSIAEQVASVAARVSERLTVSTHFNCTHSPLLIAFFFFRHLTRFLFITFSFILLKKFSLSSLLKLEIQFIKC